MKSLWLIAMLASVASMHALQGATPEAALEEIATATRPEVLARHLPEPLQKSIDALPKGKKEEFLAKLLELKSSHFNGCTVRPAHDSEGWEIIGENGKTQGKVTAQAAFVSGVEAMLPLRIDVDDDSQDYIVTMHLEGSEWIIDHFGPWTKSDLGLEKMLHEPTPMEKNEEAAKETLQTIGQALLAYARHHPDIGFPLRLKILTEPSAGFRVTTIHDGEIGFEQRPWLDDSYATDPLTRSGYLFLYRETSTGSGQGGDFGSFEVTATPIEFGKTGAKNYLLDVSGIHVTTENRPPTGDDQRPED